MIEGSLIHLGDKRMANITFVHGRKELSLTVDNGPLCRTEKLYRGDLRCFSGKEDVTAKVFQCGQFDIVSADVENMAKAMNWLQLSSEPFANV